MAVLVLVILLVLAVMFGVGWVLSQVAINPKPWTDMPGMKREEFEMYGISAQDWDENWQREDFTLQSPRGYSMYGALFPRKADMPPKDGRERVAIVVHGHGVSHFCSAKYATMFRDMGFSVIVYDHRNHGYSGKAPTTMGALEAKDLCLVCDWARNRFGEDCVLGTHGESMGAATVMLHSALDEKLSFVVEDCGYSNLTEQLSYVMRTRFHLPAGLFMPMACIVAWMRTGGVWFPDIRPADAVANSKNIPMMFIHGEADTYVPYYMLQKNFDAKTTGARSKLSVPGAEHARSYLTNPEAYRKAVKEFLTENNIL